LRFWQSASRLVFSQSIHLLGPIPVILIQIPIKLSLIYSRMDFSAGTVVEDQIFLRKTKARTFDAIGQALKTITPEDTLGWFNSCGYVASQA
jgi:hypothetical protein